MVDEFDRGSTRLWFKNEKVKKVKKTGKKPGKQLQEYHSDAYITEEESDEDDHNPNEKHRRKVEKHSDAP